MPHADAVASKSVESMNIFGQPLTIFGVPVERDTIFSDYKGNYKNRVEKRQRKLIAQTPFVKFFLHHDERILCLTTGYAPISVLEQVLTGPAFLFFKRALFVFTDKRILHIPTRFNHTIHGAISQIRYGDCTRIHLKGRSLVAAYKDGRQEVFPYLGRKEKKKIKVLLDNIASRPMETGQLQRRVHLCPSCTNVLNDREFVCPSCKLAFKSSLKAKLGALLIPGGGYLYSRCNFPGVVVGSMETALLVYLAYMLAWLKAGQPVNFTVSAVCLGMFVAIKIITVFHAHQLVKNFIPEKNNFTMRKI
jgi:hypothetical protein